MKGAFGNTWAPRLVGYGPMGAILATAVLLVSCSTPRPEIPVLDRGAHIKAIVLDTTPVNPKADGLRAELLTEEETTRAIGLLAELGQELRRENGSVLVNEALQWSRTIGYAQGEADAIRRLGVLEAMKLDLNSADSLVAISAGMTAGRSNAGWPLLHVKALHTMGQVARMKRNNSRAIELLDSASTIAERLGDHEWLGACLGAIGAAHLAEYRHGPAMDYFLKSLELARSVGDDQQAIAMYNQIGQLYRLSGEPIAAINTLDSALHLAAREGMHVNIMEIHYSLGDAHLAVNDFPNALFHYQRASDIGWRLGRRDAVAATQHLIGNIHETWQDIDKAMQHYKQSLEMSDGPGLEYNRSTVHLSLARIYSDRLDFSLALAHLDTALSVSAEINDVELNIKSHLARGDVLLAMGEPEKALTHFDQAQGSARSIDHGHTNFFHLRKARVAITRGNLPMAIKFGEEALATARAENEGPLHLSRVAELLYTAYKASGRSDDALRMHELHVSLRDSLFNEQQMRMLARVEFEAQEELVRSELAALKLMRDKDLTQQKLERELVLMGAGSGIVLATLLVVGWSRSRRHERQLALKNEELVRTQEQLLRTAKEREAEQVRTQIARDIHDELGSELTKITMMSAEIRDQEKGGIPQDRDHFERIATLSRQVNSTLNDIVWAVDPEHDSVTDLVMHARVFTDRLLENAEIGVTKHFVHKGPDRPIDPATKRHIFLILKEALNNALKYSAANELQISLETTPHSFHLEVKDNGIGFDPATPLQEGNGLRNIKARCRALNAELILRTSRGGGCSVQASGTIP